MKCALWIVPELKGGIQTYGKALFPAIVHATRSEWGWTALECLPVEPANRDDVELIHLQHEYALFGGSKLPGRYHFARDIARLRKQFPRAKIVLTAHTVLPPDYRFNEEASGFSQLLRWIANRTVLPLCRPLWFERTFGIVDGVIVHSKTQIAAVERARCPRVKAIAHFVYEKLPQNHVPTATQKSHVPTVVVFGYFTPDKGQDLVIDAWAELKKRWRSAAPFPQLVLAGGVRRSDDQAYFDACQRQIVERGLEREVRTTGFLPEAEVAAIYADASLVIAPFRQTSGSGSLARGFAQGAALLVSDLPLNREIAERVPGAVEFFRSGDPHHCAEQVERLLASASDLEKLRQAGAVYAAQFSLERTAQAHAEFYAQL